MYPSIVLFVESPSNALRKLRPKGPVWEDFRENVLLKLTDIAENVRERVEETMRQHYKWCVRRRGRRGGPRCS
jgi:hypothetical protein